VKGERFDRSQSAVLSVMGNLLRGPCIGVPLMGR
jgi:hypothetical protein